jgi:hypothetical protein
LQRFTPPCCRSAAMRLCIFNELGLCVDGGTIAVKRAN